MRRDRTMLAAAALGAALVGFWPAGPNAQASALGRCGVTSAGSFLEFAPGGATARGAIIKRLIKCLQATGHLPAGGPRGTERFITLDPPGSTFTTPTGITPDGTIVGLYCSTPDCASTGGFAGAHGFVRTPTGRFATFDPPGSTDTVPTSVSPSGEIAGAYCDTAACPHRRGFIRARDGAFTVFDSPGNSDGLFASIWNFNGSPPPSINPAGDVAGTYFDASGEHGFLRDKHGVMTTIDAPSSPGFTEVLGINPSGVTVGDPGFIRFPNGSFAKIESPDLCPGTAIPFGGINPAGVVAGAGCQEGRGFVWTPDGKITNFAVPGGNGPTPTAINPAGARTGFSFGSEPSGFVRTPDGAIVQFGVPSAALTLPTGINPAGAIVGFYYDANGVQHGFLRLPW
jgi:hypothetical protein